VCRWPNGKGLAQLVARGRNPGYACDQQGSADRALPIPRSGLRKYEPENHDDGNDLHTSEDIKWKTFQGDHFPLRAGFEIIASPFARDRTGMAICGGSVNTAVPA
jgi:hypothetical protein